MGSDKGGWARLQAQDHEQGNRFLDKVRRVHLHLQLLSCGRFQRQGRANGFSGQCLHPGSQTGADGVPSFAA